MTDAQAKQSERGVPQADIDRATYAIQRLQPGTVVILLNQSEARRLQTCVEFSQAYDAEMNTIRNTVSHALAKVDREASR